MTRTTTKVTKARKPNQADLARRFGDACSYVVGESALNPGEVQISQYASLLVGPLSTSAARAIAMAMLAACDAIDAERSR